MAPSPVEDFAIQHFLARGEELAHLVSYHLRGSVTGTYTATTA
jgi:hypothetical protein